MTRYGICQIGRRQPDRDGLNGASIRAFDRRDALAAYGRQGHKCAICGQPFEFGQMHGGHITPRVRGGRTVPENCQMPCRDCNLKKGAQA